MMDTNISSKLGSAADISMRREALQMASAFPHADHTVEDTIKRADAIFRYISGGRESDTGLACSAGLAQGSQSVDGSVRADHNSSRAGPSWEDLDGTWADKRIYRVVDTSGHVVAEFKRLNDLSMKGAGNALQWPIQIGSGPFKIYASVGDGFGFIGMAEEHFFLDDNIAPDMARPLPA